MHTTFLIPAVTTRLLALLSLGLLLMTCKSQEDMLPSATQTGQNTFGCLINGKSYVPDGGNGFMPAKPISGGFIGIQANPYRIGINVYTTAKNNQHVEIFLNNYSPGQYLLNNDTQPYPTLLAPKNYGLYESSQGDTHITSSKYSGWVNITKADTASGIVSGTFGFTAATKDGKTISISDGRFDVNTRTL